MSSNTLDPPEVASAVDLLSDGADAELAVIAENTGSFTIDGGDEEGNDIPTPLKERPPSSGSQQKSKSGAKMAKLSDKTSKIMNDYQAYLQEIETEFPSDTLLSETHVDQVKESIRAGYQEKYATPPSDIASMTKEFNPPSDTPLRRGWDLGDDEEEGALNMTDHLVNHRTRYTHPLLHSKKFKKTLCATLAVTAAVIIGASVSTNNKEKNVNLTNWEGEYETSEEGMNEEHEKSFEHDEEYQADMSYKMAATTYHPVLFDRERDSGYPDGSYREAWEFCAQLDGYGLCPYAAVCPNGEGAGPTLGVQSGGALWNPVSDKNDEWVQLAEDGQCSLYSSEFGQPPAWGRNGGSTDETRSLICCKFMEEELRPIVATSAGSAFIPANNEPALIEFDRSKDWTGQTYGQAADFCGQKGYSICPFDAICPDGMNHAPSSGLKPGSDGQWAPISDEIHDWVQVGTDIPCTRWLSRHPGPPAWSTTGKGNEKFTRYIYCCSGSVYTAAAVPAASLTTTTFTTTTSTTKIPALENTNEESEAVAMVEAVVEAGPPPAIQWFDRSTGYDGETYQDASDFCVEFANAQLCDYSELCPSGQGTAPNGGFKVSPGEAWVPFKESRDLENDNAWVSVSAGNVCTRYDRLHAGPPFWGIRGGNEEVTRNVACCHETQPPTRQVSCSY